MPRPEPQQRCVHCKDGGVAPFYTFWEKDSGGWRTGRSVTICHTCYYNNKRPVFRNDMTISHPEKPGSLHTQHVKGPDEEDEPDPTIDHKWLTEADKVALQAQATMPTFPRMKVQTNAETLAHTSHMYNPYDAAGIAIQGAVPTDATIGYNTDDVVGFIHTDQPITIDLPVPRTTATIESSVPTNDSPTSASENVVSSQDVKMNTTHEEKHENKHSLPGKKRATRRHKEG